jgi:uncharacterized protein
MTDMPRPIPNMDDLDTAGFFKAAAEHKLTIRTCTQCGASYSLPREYCRECGAFAMEWKEVSGKATLHAYTVVTHPVHPAFPVPYTAVLVDLVDVPGARMVGNIPGEHHLEVGQAMEVWFEHVEDGIVLPQWKVAQ